MKYFIMSLISSACTLRVNCYILHGQSFGHHFQLANCDCTEKKEIKIKKLREIKKLTCR